jgi:single-strand DNA-binding protein
VPRGLNKVTIIGNLGRDPEMRYTPTGQPVTTFGVACTRTYTTLDGDRREVTEWFNVVAWRRLAEICLQHLARGSRVYVEGRLQTRTWADDQGQRQQRVEVVASEMIVLDGARRDMSVHEEPEHRASANYEPYEPDEHHNDEES